MAKFQKLLKCVLTWDFLAPNRAHNRCDAAAAHWKEQIEILISNFHMLSQIVHLAFANSKLKNSMMIEVENEIPLPINSKPVDPFMRDAFRFEYSDPKMQKEKCRHPCYGKGCGHVCCNRTEEIEVVEVTVTDRFGIKSVQTLKSIEYCAPSSEVNQPDNFWGSETHLKRLYPAESVRVSSVNLNQNMKDNFDWESISYDENDDVDDDFI